MKAFFILISMWVYDQIQVYYIYVDQSNSMLISAEKIIFQILKLALLIILSSTSNDLHSSDGSTIQLGITISIRIQLGIPTSVWYSTWNSNLNGDKFGRVLEKDIQVQSNHLQS